MTIKSLDKAISILNCFSLENSVWGVGRIAHATGQTKSTASRLLATLEKRGCVKKAEGCGKCPLAYRGCIWGNISQKQRSLPVIARPVIKKLSDRCREDVSLYVVEGERRVCVERVESLHEIAKTSPVGTLFPLHAGASDKIFACRPPLGPQKKGDVKSNSEKIYGSHRY